MSVANIFEWMNVCEVLKIGKTEVQAGLVWHIFFLCDFALAQLEN
jgi:hypothetical protein